MSELILHGEAGWGSALVEAQLAFYGLPFRFVPTGDLFEQPEAAAELRKVNPLAQVPTLVLEDGSILTESAAITLFLADLTGLGDLVPDERAPERAAFLRWLVFMVANIYPTFTFADDPARFVAVEEAREPFQNAVRGYREKLWRTVEGAAGAPWFLGSRFSALDIFVAVMTQWRPRRSWFAAETPKLSAIALATEREPALAPVFARNFPAGGA